MNSMCVVVLAFAAIIAQSQGGLISSYGVLNNGPIDSAAVIAGPSGTVVRSGLAAHSVAHQVPLTYAAPYVSSYHGINAYTAAVPSVAAYAAAVPYGHGLEGQWIPDINEKLYDDGSYKPHVYGF